MFLNYCVILHRSPIICVLTGSTQDGLGQSERGIFKCMGDLFSCEVSFLVVIMTEVLLALSRGKAKDAKY